MKINTDAINGYSDMTPEQKLAALEAYEFEVTDNSEEITKLKNSLSKSNSEAANYRKQLQERMTEKEKADAAAAEAEADRQKRETELLEKLNDYEKREKIATAKANFIGAGYSAEQAEASAKALVEGKTETLFSDLKTVIEGLVNSAKAQALGTQPNPTPGTPPKPIDKDEEELKKMAKWLGGGY